MPTPTQSSGDVALTTAQDLQQRAKRCTHCHLLTNVATDLRWEINATETTELALRRRTSRRPRQLPAAGVADLRPPAAHPGLNRSRRNWPHPLRRLQRRIHLLKKPLRHLRQGSTPNVYATRSAVPPGSHSE